MGRMHSDSLRRTYENMWLYVDVFLKVITCKSEVLFISCKKKAMPSPVCYEVTVTEFDLLAAYFGL